MGMEREIKKEIESGIEDHELSQVPGVKGAEELAHARVHGESKSFEVIDGIRIINESLHPREVIEEAIRIAKDADLLRYDPDTDKYDEIRPSEIRISPYLENFGMILRIKYDNGFVTNDSFGTKKIMEWERAGIV